jgi:uncharacterized damage-inducible protein DinB
MTAITSLKSQAESLSEVEVFRHSAGIVHKIVHLSVDDLTQAESLIQPRPAGNCLNWVVGHLVCVYDHLLPVVGAAPVMTENALKRYDRGAPPIKDAAEARELPELMAALDQATERLDAGLANLTSETLDAPAPFSPSGNPNETVRSLLNTILFHQSYHAGQVGMLRRMAGKKGALG